MVSVALCDLSGIFDYPLSSSLPRLALTKPIHYNCVMAEVIKNFDELKNLSGQDGGCECFISLAGGLARSSKHIWDNGDGTFDVLNEVDDSEQVLTKEEFWTESNIGEALDKGALFLY